MTHLDWQAVRRIYPRLREVPAPERDAFLAEMCGDDAVLRDELNRMLAADEGDGSFLTPPDPTELARTLRLELPAPPGPGARIGRYELVRVLGSGGMGTVYEAIQQKPRRRVALKVVRGELFDPEKMKRLELEIQALALLHHPGIVPLYDSGRTDDNSPYFAMEYVDGRSLDRFVAESQLTQRDRLRLFLEIAAAIAYAHQKGVIHRDLKPSNILIADADGTPASGSEPPRRVRVLDFGLARITDADVSRVSLPTETGRILGTLAYMSPEQASGDSAAVDQRSDVYALGVILYELLTGHRPYDLSGCWIGDAVARIRGEEPAPLRRWLGQRVGDLQTIVSKALEKDAERRYAGAAALAEDVERYLAGHPILAHPPSTTYQLRKLILRHKLASTIVASALLAGVSFTLNQRHMLRLVEDERIGAEEVLRFQQRMLASVDPARDGRSVKLLEVIDDASRRFHQQHFTRPPVEAAIRATIGNGYRALSEYDKAEPHLLEALRLLRTYRGDRHADTLTAEINLGLLRQSQGRFAEAEDLLRAAVDGRRALLGETHVDSLEAANQLGWLLQDRGRLDEAERLYQESLATARQELDEQHPVRLAVMNNLAALMKDRSQHQVARELYEQVLDIRRRKLGEHHPDTIASMHNLACLLQWTDQAASEHLFRQVVDADTAVLGLHHKETLAATINLAGCLYTQRRLDPARELYEQLSDLLPVELGADHPYTLSASGNLAACYHALGRPDDAERLYRATLDGLRRTVGEQHQQSVTVLYGLATLLQSRNRLGEAIDLYRDGTRLAPLVYSTPEGHPFNRLFPEQYARCLIQAGRHADAEAVLLQRYQSVAATGDPSVVSAAVTALIDLYHRWDRPDDAQRWQLKLLPPAGHRSADDSNRVPE